MESKITHLYGEMDIDFSKTVDQIYRKAANIAEACGYVVTYEKDTDGKRYLEFLGEDCVDSIIVTTRAYYDPATKMITSVEKVVMKDDYPKNEIIKRIPIPI